MKILGVFAIDKSDIHAKGQGQTSKFKVTVFKTNFANEATLNFMGKRNSWFQSRDISLRIYDINAIGINFTLMNL